MVNSINYDYMADMREDLDAAVEIIELNHKRLCIEAAESYPLNLSDFADKAKLSLEQIELLDSEECQCAYVDFINVMAKQLVMSRNKG